jgi:hypothetical protein
LACAQGVRADGQPPRRIVEYRHDDTLSVDVVDEPLADVLAEIARQSGAEIRGQPRDSRSVTARFDRVPLSQALDRMLAGQNYALIYGEDGRLRAIPLLGGPGLAASPVFTTRPGQFSGPPPADVAELLAQPVPVAGPVADALGSPTASLSQLAQLWLREEDAAVRAQSVRTGFRALEAAPELRAATVDLANTYSDADLARLVRSFAGARAEELLDMIASQTKVTELRAKATLVLRRLQSGS